MTRRPKIGTALLGGTWGVYLLAQLLGPVWPLRADSPFARSSKPASDSARPDLPHVVFWAWERPEDFRFLTRSQAGVAFLAKTVYLDGVQTGAEGARGFTVHPRLQPLQIAPGTPLIPVIRIETRGKGTRREGPPQAGAVRLDSSGASALREELASEIASLQAVSGVAAIQIDFDAPASQHALYSRLLQDVRQKLRPDLPLSITALASWCIGDQWLEKIPSGTIDEAVPMLFRMGRDGPQVVTFLRMDEQFPVAACRGSLGVSTDEEPSRAVLKGIMASPAMRTEDKRVYVFSPRAWTKEQAEEVLKELQR